MNSQILKIRVESILTTQFFSLGEDFINLLNNLTKNRSYLSFKKRDYINDTLFSKYNLRFHTCRKFYQQSFGYGCSIGLITYDTSYYAVFKLVKNKYIFTHVE